LSSGEARLTMCGITGLVYADHHHPVDQVLFRRMTGILAHRGPDADGFLFGDGVALGQRRLSIIDLSTGDQPIFNEDHSKAVILNGEIYNFRDLRAELEAHGHRFTTASDTEVIVHAWEQYGDACIARLRGMFALALWDARERRLLLARDRMGKKPLFYLHDAERIVFASELKAIVADPSVKRAVNLAAVDGYLAFGAVPNPATIYQGIVQVPPAHYVVWHRGRVSSVEYWDVPRDEPRDIDPARALGELEATLGKAVELRMIAAVPLGAFLSGGVDSTAVVGAMAARSSKPVVTTTVTFRERAFSEATHASAVADALHTDHREVLVEPTALDILPTLVWHLDEPFADSSAVPTYYVSRAARERVTVALSGDGGDEVFGGYESRYGMSLLEAKLRGRLPRPLRRGVLGPLAAIWPRAEGLPRPLRWKTAMRNLSLEPEVAYCHDLSFFPPADKRPLVSAEFERSVAGHDPFAAIARHFARARGRDHLSRIMYVDLKTWLVNDILVKVDRMSMASSLEVRSPLLDHEVIELAASLPSTLKFRDGVSKYLLKRYSERHAPASVIHRPKKGFTIPLAEWLRGPLRSTAAELLLSERARHRGYFDAGAVRSLWDQHDRRQRDRAHQIWTLMMLELWHRMFLDQMPPTSAPRVLP